jgi:hypothetical protein
MGEAKRKGQMQLVGLDESKYFQPTGHLSGAKEPERAGSWLIIAVGVLLVAAIGFWSWSAFAQAASQPAPAPEQNWETKILELAGAAVMAGLTYVFAAAKAYFSAHAKGAFGTYAISTLTRLELAVTSAVAAEEQIALRDLAAGLNKKSAAQLKQDAIASVKAELGPKGLADLAEVVGLDQVATVLSTKIESAVLRLPSSSAQAAAPAVAAAQSAPAPTAK